LDLRCYVIKLFTAVIYKQKVGQRKPVGGNQPIKHPWTSILSLPDGTRMTAFTDVSTDVRRENTDVRWVGFLPPRQTSVCLK
jgi:hypothetical protein